MTASEPADNVIPRLVTSVIDELQAQLEVVAERRRALIPGHFDPDVVAAAATLAKAIATCAAELRARDKMQAGALKPAAVMAWLEALPEDELFDVLRPLSHLFGIVRKLEAEHGEPLL